MSKFKWALGSIFALALVFIACQKEISSAKDSDDFDQAAAKEWYYAEFKKSAEWQGSSLKGNKLPDWHNGVTGKIGTSQVVEFPLVKKTKSFPLTPSSKGKTLTESELKRVVNASISKIAFFKTSSGKIVVREIDYVPDWDYLQKRGFDISDVSAFSENNKFSGNIFVKQWNGEIISSLVLENGKIVKTGKKVILDGQPTVNNLDCQYVDYCIWQQDCTLTIYADGMMTNECGEWYNTGNCWLQEVCNGEIDPCLAYGNNCDPGNGNTTPECQSITCAEASAIADGVTTTISQSNESTSESETAPDENGIIRRSVIVMRTSFTYNAAFWSSTYTLVFPGKLYKTTTNSVWKWESLSFREIKKTSGSNPPCFSLNVSASIAGPDISNDKLSASFSGTVTATITVPCLGGAEARTYTDNVSEVYYASNF